LLLFKAIGNPTATLWFWTVNFILREFLSQLTSIYVDMRLPKIIENTSRFDSKYGRPTEQRTRPRYYVIAYLGCTFTLLACGCIDILLNKLSAKVFYESILRYAFYNNCTTDNKLNIIRNSRAGADLEIYNVVERWSKFFFLRNPKNIREYYNFSKSLTPVSF